MRRFYVIVPVLLFAACQTTGPAQKILDAHHKVIGDLSEIQTITATATCEGPDGPYSLHTESSFLDDYLLFQQNNPTKPSFYAAILNESEGYGLDTTLRSQGKLSEAVIALLKGHEFYEIVLQPEMRFSTMRIGRDTLFFDRPCVELLASNFLGLPVHLYFDQQTHLMAGLTQVNPYKKKEVIQVHFETWKEGNPGFFQQVTVYQGQHTVYRFSYQSLSVNDPDFVRWQPENTP